MAKKTDTTEEDKKLLDEIGGQYAKAETAHKEIRDGGFTWNEREDLFLGRYKHAKEATKSVLSTGELTTLAIDGACRVMAQLPSGRFYNYNGNTGSNMVMNLLFEHYIVPNATNGGPMLLKQRMTDMYSRVFPYVPVFFEWKITDKYIGPDMIVVHPRRFRAQPGKTAIEDMDYCFIDTEVSKDWLKTKLKSDPEGATWKNIASVINRANKGDEGPGTPIDDRSPDQTGKTKTGITIRHRFTSQGDWQVYAPFEKSDVLLVNEKDYFPGIPISLKTQYPSLDKLGGITDFDRGEMNQKSIDSLFRLYLGGVEASIDPPVAVDPDEVVLSSIVRQAKAKWFVKNKNVDAIKMMNISPQGMNTFQSTYQILKANLLSMGATSDTAVAASVDPGLGKTPEALKQQGAKQGARDAWDSYMMEQFIERSYTIMADMIAKKGVSNYAFQLLGTSIKKIQEEYPDEDYSILGVGAEEGNINIAPETIEGKYRFVIDTGSTLIKQDDTGIKMLNIIKTYASYPQIQADLAQSGKKVDFGEAFKRMVIDLGLQDADKIIISEQNPESVNGVGAQGATVDANGQPIPAQPSPEIQQLQNEIQQLAGMIQKIQQNKVKSPTETINYKDVPEDVKREIEAAAGLTPSRIGAAPGNAVNPITHPNG